MDTEISTQIISQRKRKRLLIIAGAIAMFGLAVWATRSFIVGSIKRSEINTAKTEIGNIENTLSATGEVLPEFEEVISNPINASIKNAVLDAGTKVKPGQSIMILDKSATENEYNKLRFQLENKHAEIQKMKLDLNKSFYDLKSSNDIKQLRIANLRDAVENTKRLYKAGGATLESVEQAELNLKVALLEKKQLENEITSKQQTMRVEEREAEIAAEIQQNDLNELERKLKLANVVATRTGVITYVNKNIGATVHEGETLARIADLNSFKVKATIADSYLDQLHNGMPVIVKINETQLRGHVVNIYPSVQNGIVTFDVQLDERDNKQLRPNMKVDVYPVTAAHNGIIRIANGPAFKGPAVQDVFVVKDNKAERRTIHVGLSNFDYIEVTSGLKPGEEVVTSDMSDYKNTRELTITNQ